MAALDEPVPGQKIRVALKFGAELKECAATVERVYGFGVIDAFVTYGKFGPHLMHDRVRRADDPAVPQEGRWRPKD
jgi:hypothetical protein